VCDFRVRAGATVGEAAATSGAPPQSADSAVTAA